MRDALLDSERGYWVMPIQSHVFFYRCRMIYDDLCVCDETGCLDSGLL
jgi:hypothetical protein